MATNSVILKTDFELLKFYKSNLAENCVKGSLNGPDQVLLFCGSIGNPRWPLQHPYLKYFKLLLKFHWCNLAETCMKSS